jgi:hypothetical protein
MKAVVKAVLMHPEARVQQQHFGQAARAGAAPVGLLRAFNYRERHRLLARGQHRQPGHVTGPGAAALAFGVQLLPPRLCAAGHAGRQRGLVVPEMQITHESSVAGYVNAMRDNVSAGVGSFEWHGRWCAGEPARHSTRLCAELALAADPAALVDGCWRG